MQKKMLIALLIILGALFLVVGIYLAKNTFSSVTESIIGEGSYLSLGPGNCNNQEECTNYCLEHAQDCIDWCNEKQALCPPYLKENLKMLEALT